jgi:hypothetical protein
MQRGTAPQKPSPGRSRDLWANAAAVPSSCVFHAPSFAPPRSRPLSPRRRHAALRQPARRRDSTLRRCACSAVARCRPRRNSPSFLPSLPCRVRAPLRLLLLVLLEQPEESAQHGCKADHRPCFPHANTTARATVVAGAGMLVPSLVLLLLLLCRCSCCCSAGARAARAARITARLQADHPLLAGLQDRARDGRRRRGNARPYAWSCSCSAGAPFFFPALQVLVLLLCRLCRCSSSQNQNGLQADHPPQLTRPRPLARRDACRCRG